VIAKRERRGVVELLCHSRIVKGELHFLPDTTHELAGRTVPMEAS
jgi:hypothetical protein